MKIYVVRWKNGLSGKWYTSQVIAKDPFQAIQAVNYEFGVAHNAEVIHSVAIEPCVLTTNSYES